MRTPLLLLAVLALAACEAEPPPPQFTLTTCQLDLEPEYLCSGEGPGRWEGTVSPGTHTFTVRATTFRQRPDGTYDQSPTSSDSWTWTVTG